LRALFRAIRIVLTLLETATARANGCLAITKDSMGGNVVLLYASQYDDVAYVVNLCGRFRMDQGLYERFSTEERAQLDQQGWFMWKTLHHTKKVTKESIQDRLKVDMSQVKNIRKACVLTVHGSDDVTVPVEDAHSFDKLIPQHTLVVLRKADHLFASSDSVDDMIRAVAGFLPDYSHEPPQVQPNPLPPLRKSITLLSSPSFETSLANASASASASAL